jgi:hypothetical protein
MFVILCRRNDQWVTLLVLVVAVGGTGGAGVGFGLFVVLAVGFDAGVAGAVVFSYWWCR